jgi:hypothetical protein
MRANLIGARLFRCRPFANLCRSVAQRRQIILVSYLRCLQDVPDDLLGLKQVGLEGVELLTYCSVIMKNMPPPEKSLLDLVADLRDETKELIRQEIQLAKTEVAEKAAKFGRNAAWLAVGGFLAYAGLIVFLIGLGFLIGFALEALGMAQAVANFLGSAIIGLGTAGIGYFLLAKALKILSRNPHAGKNAPYDSRVPRSNTEPSLPSRRRPARGDLPAPKWNP